MVDHAGDALAAVRAQHADGVHLLEQCGQIFGFCGRDVLAQREQAGVVVDLALRSGRDDAREGRLDAGKNAQLVGDDACAFGIVLEPGYRNGFTAHEGRGS